MSQLLLKCFLQKSESLPACGSRLLSCVNVFIYFFLCVYVWFPDCIAYLTIDTGLLQHCTVCMMNCQHGKVFISGISNVRREMSSLSFNRIMIPPSYRNFNLFIELLGRREVLRSCD